MTKPPKKMTIKLTITMTVTTADYNTSRSSGPSSQRWKKGHCYIWWRCQPETFCGDVNHDNFM